MKKVVLKLDVPDDKAKIKVMKTVSSLAGVDSISLDMKDQKLTVTGDTDPVIIVSKLRKLCQAEIVAVGPAKEEKKKEEPKKEEPKKQEDQKKDQKDQKAENNIPVTYYAYPSMSQYPSISQQPPYYFSDENPNACVIS